MNDIDRSILATLAYYGAFGWPLTAVEIRQRLIPARRLGGRDAEPTLNILLERLDVLGKLGMVVQEEGLSMLAPAGEGFARARVRMEKECAQKWRRIRRTVWWLQAVPYVRALLASGSLALGNTGPESDWDVTTIAAPGRLYTARLGLLAVAKLMGRLRTKRDRSAPDKFCFNHYLAADSLALRHRSLYTAHGLATLLPLYDPSNVLEALWRTNDWMAQFVAVPESAEYVHREVGTFWPLRVLAWCTERVLDTPLGNVLERGVRTWMRRRIARTPATHEPGGRVIADDQELEFHPRSFEAIALARYNAVLDRFGFGAYAEHDSGLTR